MTITISGTTGLAGVDGSAGTPAVQGADSNTGIFFPAADTVAIATGGTERVRTDSSGNVGIGAASGGQRLFLYKAGGAVTTAFQSDSNSNGQSIDFLNSAAGMSGQIYYLPSSGYMALATAGTERARIDSSGNLLVGGTGRIVYSKVLSQFNGSADYGFVANDTSNAAGVGFAAFAVNGTSTGGAIGSITRNGSSSAVLYNTTSDQRLKENIADADAALGTVAAIKVRKYDWKEGGQHEDYGFIAQELAEVVNNVVSKGRTEEDMWAVDYGKLTPLLCKAIQELTAKLTAAEARIAALEGAQA